MKVISEIKKDSQGISRLYVDDEPFLILGGELHNSSASDFVYMEEQVWPNLRGMYVNTILLPVTWETLEPNENEYDFSAQDIEMALNRKRFLLYAGKL